MSADRIPPHVPEAELALCGAAIFQPDLAEQINPSLFYVVANRQLAEAIAAQWTARKTVDPVTLPGELAAHAGIDSGVAVALVAAAQDACPSSCNAANWLDDIRRAALKRNIVSTAQQAIAAAMTPGADAGVSLDDFERAVLAIRQRHGANGEDIDIRAELKGLMIDYQGIQEGTVEPGIKTGFDDLDALIGGLRPGQLFVLAANTSVGKTALSLNIAERLAVTGSVPVALFSLEMTAKELLHRMSCSLGRIDGKRLMTQGAATERDLKALTVAVRRLRDSKLHIHDRPGLTTGQLAGKARRLVREHGVKLIVVDHLGLVHSGRRTTGRYEETTLVSNALKALALELKTPVLCLCQLNRDNARDARAPRMSDLRDSGAIEQDADLIGLLHREDESRSEEIDSITLNICKNRGGPTGSVRLAMFKKMTRFESVSHRTVDDLQQAA